ncbi:MAG TPA: hypothetical protein VI542_00830 [Candidatus Tectomicrobia bacterium]
MGTVIHDKQQRNDDHHLRWERPRRAALLDPYRDLHAQGCSLRQAAKGLWRKVRFLGQNPVLPTGMLDFSSRFR